LTLALQLIDQISEDAYDPGAFHDDEKQRILAAIDEKISGKQVVASAHAEAPTSGQVIDLMDALRASLGKQRGKAPATAAESAEAIPEGALKERKPARRAPKVAEPEAAPARTRARK